METGFDVVASSSVVNGCQENRKKPAINLPPGFRFHPTDEEIIGYYLMKKVADGRFCAIAIGEADFNKCEPWDLPKMAKMGEKEWFFFSHRDRKYPTGIRTNRATRAGYWKATGKDKEVYKGRNNLVGMKKTLVFYLGRAPKGEKTNWVMHEYRIEGDVLISNRTYSSEEWAVCKVFHKNVEITRNVDLPGNVTIVDRHTANHSTLPPVTNVGVAANDGHLASSSAFPPVTKTGFAANDYHNDGSKEKFASPPDILLGDPNNLIASFQNIGHVTMDNPFLNNTNFGQGNPISFPNEIFPSPAPPFASPLGYQQDNGQSSMVFNNHCNVVPFNGVDQASVGMMPPNIELFSSNNSAVSRSQDTGLGAENIVNDISSVPSIEQNSSTMAQDLEGFNFINSLLDLDFLWSK